MEHNRLRPAVLCYVLAYRWRGDNDMTQCKHTRKIERQAERIRELEIVMGRLVVAMKHINSTSGDMLDPVRRRGPGGD